MSVDEGTSLPQMAQNVTSQVTESAGQAKQNLLEQGRQQLNDRTTTAGEQVSGFAAVARKVATSLREDGNEPHAKAADTVAERVEQVGTYLQDADPDKMLRDLEDLGRRQPAALAAGGVVLGLLAARFLKASSAQRYPGSAAPQSGYQSWSKQAPDASLGDISDDSGLPSYGRTGLEGSPGLSEIDPYRVPAGTPTGYQTGPSEPTLPRDPLVG
jgi:hypothetical protein